MSEEAITSAEPAAAVSPPPTITTRFTKPIVAGSGGTRSGVDLDMTAGAIVETRDPFAPPATDTRKPKASMDSQAQPLETWAQDILPEGHDWRSGQFLVRVYRDMPEFHYFPELKRRVPVKGFLGETRDLPSEELISSMFGGGTQMRIVVLGPDTTGRSSGSMVTLGHRIVSVAGEPKMPIGGDERIVSENTTGSDNLTTQIATRALTLLADSNVEAKKAVEEERKRADSAQADADRRVGHDGVRSMEVVKEALGEKAEVYKEIAANAERRSEALEARLRQVEAAASSHKNGSNGDGAIASIFASSMDNFTKLATAGRPGESGTATTEAVRDTIRDLQDRHTTETATIHRQYGEQLTALREETRRQIDALNASHTTTVNDVRDRATKDLLAARDEAARRDTVWQERLDRDRRDLNEKHETVLKSQTVILDSTHKSELAAKDMQLSALKSDIERYRDDLRDYKDKLSRSESERQAAQMSLAEIKAELMHRPKAAGSEIDILDKVFSNYERMTKVFGGGKSGGDDDGAVVAPSGLGIGEMVRELVMSPEARSLGRDLLKETVGLGDKERAFQAEQAANANKVEAIRHWKDGMVAREKMAKRGLPVPPPIPNPGAASPGAGQAAAPAAAQTDWGRKDDEDNIPARPAVRSLSGDAAQIEMMLDAAENCVRGDQEPDVLLDGFKAQGRNEVFLRDNVTSKASPDEFLARMAIAGAEHGFPALYHPAGRRWVKKLWARIAVRAGA